MSDKRISTEQHSQNVYALDPIKTPQESRLSGTKDHEDFELSRREILVLGGLGLLLIVGGSVVVKKVLSANTSELERQRSAEVAKLNVAAQTDGFDGVSAAEPDLSKGNIWRADVNVGDCVLHGVVVDVEKTDLGKDITDYSFYSDAATYDFQDKAELEAKYPDDGLCFVVLGGNLTDFGG